MLQKIHYTYRITHTPSGKYYLGKRTARVSCPTLDFKYLGSGLLIRRAIHKHGSSEFSKEILQTYDSLEELNAAERNLITIDVINDPMSYNIALGGHGGDLGPHVYKRLLITVKSDSYRSNMSRIKSDPLVIAQTSAAIRRTMSCAEWKRKFSQKQREVQNQPHEIERNRRNQIVAQNRPDVKKAKSDRMIKAFQNPDTIVKHKTSVNTDSFKQATSQRRSDTVWIHLGDQKKCIKSHLVDNFIKDGWSLGMKPPSKKRKRPS